MAPDAFIFSSKADTLQKLSAYADLHIPPLSFFTVGQWRARSREIWLEMREKFADGHVAVRSSCLREDSDCSSGAGAYLSALNVHSADEAAFAEAVEQVIASYGGAEEADQVLVQTMIAHVAVTGVIMTRALADGSPYYVINYDDESGRTDSITGGSGVSKTVCIYRSVRSGDFDSPRLRGFVELARRVEALCGRDALDIEFCLDTGNTLHLLQARPICASRHWPASEQALGDIMGNLASFIGERTARDPRFFGARSILGVMPDWNPAEMIGLLPRPLAASLYRNLITCRVWSSARQRMGYRALPSTELMLLCAGRPYIDVRASFNSFLPASINPIAGEALVGAWLERLDANPHLHDKVEFEIAQTCLDFSFDVNFDERYAGLLSRAMRDSFRNALRVLTAACLEDGALAPARDAISELRARQAGRPGHDSRRLAAMLSECRKLGTLPFAILARHAFMAESLLRSAVARGAFSPERLAAFRRSIRTISTELAQDFAAVSKGERSASSFMLKYGHLRPGSYDILSPRYDDRPDLFASARKQGNERPEAEVFQLAPQEEAAIGKLLRESGLPGSAAELLRYAREAIAGRELAKFVFSRHLSDILEIVAAWAQGLGLDRETASWLPIQTILDQSYCIGSIKPARYLEDIAACAREEFARNARLKLGYLIRSERDVYIVPQHRAAPNFIGAQTIVAAPVRLFAASGGDIDLASRIVCIENADPGFDWIFTRGIGGLVTQFGGANSHMAIRCAEYGLPAAIGVGEKLFSDITACELVRLDPANAILKDAQC